MCRGRAEKLCSKLVRGAALWSLAVSGLLSHRGLPALVLSGRVRVDCVQPPFRVRCDSPATLSGPGRGWGFVLPLEGGCLCAPSSSRVQGRLVSPPAAAASPPPASFFVPHLPKHELQAVKPSPQKLRAAAGRCVSAARAQDAQSPEPPAAPCPGHLSWRCRDSVAGRRPAVCLSATPYPPGGAFGWFPVPDTQE